MNITRIATLVDGVFAIVMTLLVFDFKVPDIPEAKIAQQLLPKLLKLWPRMITYVLSFVVLGVYWVAHHNQFRLIVKIDRNMIWINILFLMAVAFVPFSSALLGQYGNRVEAVILYGVNLIIIGMILYWHWSYATHRYRLIKNDIEETYIKRINSSILGSNFFYVLAMLCSFYSTRISIFIYVLVPLYFVRPHGLFKRKKIGKSSTPENIQRKS